MRWSSKTRIGRAIGPAGEVLDSASPALSRIRKEVRIAHGRLMDRLNRFVGGSNPALQDAIVTSRDGRYVVPVRADSRGQIPGVVHDVSSSGQTIFVEPLEVVELNNRWREAQIEETREVDRILDELSHETGRYANELRLTVESVARIDFAMAKARLAFLMRAIRPVIWSQVRQRRRLAGHPSQRIRLRRARHPLLDPDDGGSDRCRSGRGLPGSVDHRSEYRRQDRRAQNGGAAGGDGAGRFVHSSGRSSRSCRFSPRSLSTSATTRASRRVSRPFLRTLRRSSRCWSRSSRPAWC